MTKKTEFTAGRAALVAVLSALALCSFVVENLFPPLFLPGVKLGLGNAFSLFALIVLGPIEGIVVTVIRTTLGSLIVGNMSTLLYSLTAGLVAVVLQAVLVRFLYPTVSVVAVSVCGAVVHNITQNTVFVLVSQTPQMVSYMPYLALAGVLSGVVVGVAVWLALRLLPQKLLCSLGGNKGDDFLPVETTAQSETDGDDASATPTEKQ